MNQDKICDNLAINKKIISKILEENENWLPFGVRWIYRAAMSIFEVSGRFYISTYIWIFWGFLPQTHRYFVNRVPELC